MSPTSRLGYDAMQGPDPADPVCAQRPAEPALPLIERGTDGLRVAIAGGYFRDGVPAEAHAAVAKVAAALGATREIELPQAARARAAAYVITAAEGAAPASRPAAPPCPDYDPAVRDRLIAGAMIPAAMVAERAEIPPLVSRPRARAVRRGRRDPGAGDAVHGAAAGPGDLRRSMASSMPVRANLGLYTQPISFIGLPVVAVPVPLSPLPIGVQIIAAPWREDIALRIAHALEAAGAVAAPRPAM